MKQSTPLLLLAIAIAVFSVSCNKKSTKSADEKNITSGSWKIQSVTANGADVSGFVPACVLDNDFTFQSGGVGMLKENANVCSPSNEGNFLWGFNNSRTQLTMTTDLIPGGTSDFTIITLSATTFVLSQESSLVPSPDPVTVTVTLVH